MDEITRLKNLSNFPFEQLENKCKLVPNVKNEYSFIYQKYVLDNDHNLFVKKDDNQFTFNLSINNFRDNIKSVIIICSKDGSTILEHTLKKLEEFETSKDHDILLVDDRSVSKDIYNLANKYGASYIRIDNELDIFNYSVINNIAAIYAKKFGKTLLIFHNNDMWPSSPETLKNLVNKHEKYKSNITGCRLLYPTKKSYEDLGKPVHLLNEKLEQIYDTIQHGGIFFTRMSHALSGISRKNRIVFRPQHLFRFYEKNYFFSTKDQPCFAITGALQIINISDFIEIGGLNICLASSFQDIDLCIKALEKQMTVYYVGSEYMYHAESITNAKENITKKPELITDNIIWDILWEKRLMYLLDIDNDNKKYL